MSVERTLELLASDPAGLSTAEAAKRLARHGPNRLEQRPGIPIWRLALDEARNPLVIILFGAAAVLVLVSVVDPVERRWGDAALILAIVLLNGALGFAQNYRAQRGIEALQRLATPQARVLRDGSPVTLEAADLVPGDIVLVEEGGRVVADGRLLHAAELRADEASLTGESLPVTKATDPVPEGTALADRRDMLYLGTSVASGRGRYVITATGMATEVGDIAAAVQEVVEGPTPFQREVGALARRITAVIAVLIVLIAGLQLTVGGQDLLGTFVTAVALAVAAIPEGLPVVMTLALAFGTRRMLERRSLVRSLPVVEILGGADVICSDKTGTITEGRMSLRRLECPPQSVEVTGGADEPVGEFLVGGMATDQRDNPALLAAGLCNNAQWAPDGSFSGDPTEVALLVGALKAGIDLEPWERVEEIPFTSGRRRMSVIVEREGEIRVLAKGAPEALLGRCSQIRVGAEIRPLSDDDRAEIERANDRLAAQAFRVLALAGKPERPHDRADAEQNLIFYGLAGLADPPRAAARPAIEATGSAGISVAMITGDNPGTAAAVGREIGLAGAGVTGMELEGLADDEIVARGPIYARVEPRHKLRILEAYRRDGHVVAMTGDGVNDAPALKGADVGIAMGIRGTDVARDASDMVLLDDDFATIVAAVEEGRRIAANIKKFLNYLLTGNMAEVLVILVASLAGYLPISAVQILWVNLVTDSGPALALAVDPAPPDIMRQPPRRGPVIGKPMLALVAGIGGLITIIVLATFFIGLAVFDLAVARTMTFTALVAQEYLRLVVIRIHEGVPVLANRWLLLAVGISLLLQLALVYSPIGAWFGATPLGLGSWAVVVAGLLIGLPSALGITRLVRRWLGPL